MTLAVAVASAILGATVTLYFACGDGTAATSFGDQPAGRATSEVITDTIEAPAGRAVVSQTPAPTTPLEVTSGALGNQVQAAPDLLPLADAAQHDQRGGAKHSPAAQSGDSADADTSAVAGRSFPVSESVEAICREHDEDTLCQDLHGALKRMAEERRDSFWAERMESVLRQRAAKSEHLLTIRHLECRTSICAVEVESRSGRWLLSDRELGPKESPLRFLGDTPGYERAEDGAQIWVTLRVYARK